MSVRAAGPQPLIIPGQYTIATLPDCTTCKGFLAWVTDDPLNGFTVYFSNGSAWKAIQGTANNIQRKKIVTDASGSATWTFDTPFTGAPVISFAVEYTGSPIVIGISSISNTSVTIGAKQARTLPTTLTLLTQLIGFDLFANSAIGATIHIIAVGS